MKKKDKLQILFFLFIVGFFANACNNASDPQNNNESPNFYDTAVIKKQDTIDSKQKSKEKKRKRKNRKIYLDRYAISNSNSTPKDWKKYQGISNPNGCSSR